VKSQSAVPRTAVVDNLGLDITLIIPVVAGVAVPGAAVVMVVVIPLIAVLTLPLNLAKTILAGTSDLVRELDQLENVLLFIC